MTLGFLDFNSYTYAGGFTIQQGKDLIIPQSLILSQTMLVKWQIRQLVKGVNIDQIPPAILSTSLEIVGMGVIDGDSYNINPSQQGKDRVQLIHLDPDLPHKLVLSNIDDSVTNSILEFYSSDLTMATFENPVNVSTDLSPVVTAIAAGTAAQVAATQAASAAANKTVKQLIETTYAPLPWSNTPGNHIALPADLLRTGVSILNTGSRAVSLDTFLLIGSKTSASQANGVIAPGGRAILAADEAVMGLLLYTTSGTGAASVSIDQTYATAPAAPAGA